MKKQYFYIQKEKVYYYLTDRGTYHAINFGIEDRDLENLKKRCQRIFNSNQPEILSACEYSYSMSCTNNSVYFD